MGSRGRRSGRSAARNRRHEASRGMLKPLFWDGARIRADRVPWE
ncbi:hypothetical protein [Nonomuraea sp. NPDC003804]